MASEKDTDLRPSSNNDIISYRLDKLEEAVNKLSQLSDVVLRWDARFQQQGGLMQCVLHQSRIDEFDRQIKEINRITIERTRSVMMVDEHENRLATVFADLESLKSYMNKAIGALVIISVIVQIIGPVLIDRLHLTSKAATKTASSSVVSDESMVTYFTTYSPKTNKVLTQ